MPPMLATDVFRAMALYTLGLHEAAMRSLLLVIASTSTDPHVEQCARAIRRDAGALDLMDE